MNAHEDVIAIAREEKEEEREKERCDSRQPLPLHAPASPRRGLPACLGAGAVDVVLYVCTLYGGPQ